MARVLPLDVSLSSPPEMRMEAHPRRQWGVADPMTLPPPLANSVIACSFHLSNRFWLWLPAHIARRLLQTQQACAERTDDREGAKSHG